MYDLLCKILKSRSFSLDHSRRFPKKIQITLLSPGVGWIIIYNLKDTPSSTNIPGIKANFSIYFQDTSICLEK